MATVTFENVNKVYGDFHAVHDLNLEIGDGEFMVLVGPSGCGKTTSLRMIAGLEEISSGTLRIGDRVVNDVAPKDRDIAMVFQSYALYPHMSVRENLAFGLKLRKVPKAEIERRVNEAAETIQLDKLLDRKPKELSGGQRQRVALGRAIVREPAVFLMDEPLSNLDAKLRVQTRAEIARLHQRLKTTVVYVTHDQVEAMTMGTRIAVMSDGLLQQVGTPQVLYDTPINRFVAGFIGSPSMNFVDVKLDGSGQGAQLAGPGDWRIPLPDRYREAAGPTTGRSLVMGFRPEHLDMGDPSTGVGSFSARADVVEYLGNEELLHVSAADKDIVAIVSSEHHVRPGDIVNLVIPLDKIHLFDAETGHSVAPDLAPLAAAVPSVAGRGRRVLRPSGRRLSDAPPDMATSPAPEDDSGAGLIERVVDSKVIHEGRYLTFRVDTIERADGTRSTRDIAGHPGAVAIVAVDDEDRVLLVRQFRLPAGAVLLGDPGGDPRARARRHHRGPTRGGPARTRRGDGDARSDVGASRRVLLRPGFHRGADAPVPGDRPDRGRCRAPPARGGRTPPGHPDAVARGRGRGRARRDRRREIDRRALLAGPPARRAPCGLDDERRSRPRGTRRGRRGAAAGSRSDRGCDRASRSGGHRSP